ncbi:molybdenum cofactor sulfurase [Spinacia oleracea]|uniref:Molybdenum cofactor sulfurase n=1 Tax=Spinacia oleracea TaxID=3562 RepID=A0A9R0I7V0_SPIOL|nr:molybdenum cofactor sulfurase-like [Spinacia oleracea]
MKLCSKICKCYCCLNPVLSFPTSFDHQNSENYNSSTLQYDFATATTSSLYPHTQFTNPDSLPTLQESFRSFTRSFPHYLTTVEADQIRAHDYRHLFLSSHVCLDYSGHALFSSSQQSQQQHHQQQQQQQQPQHQQQNGEFVASSSCSSTPSNDPCSKKVEEIESKLKGRIMRYLNVSEEDYSLFCTSNQTSSFGIMAESYPFQTNNNLITVYDHENEAIEAMVKTSKGRGARVSSAEFKWPKLKIHCNKLEEMLLGSVKKKKMNKGLFVFPVQSRVSGARYSYQWMSLARDNGWHVLLDASALNPKEMDTLGLSLFQPDFLICTFYKVFGQDPSGFSCLLVKKSISSTLNLSSISSSPRIMTLTHITKDGQREINECDGIECKGLDQADALGLVLVSNRIRCLINWLTNALLALYHPHSDKGVQLVQVYGPRVKFDRGSSLAFNMFDWKGERVDPMLVQKLGDRNDISVGCGLLKHVWFSERYEVEKEKVCSKEGSSRKGKGKKKRESTGNEDGIAVVTVNIGFLTNFEDVYVLWKFVSKFLDADFVEKERWRYTALNQKSFEV